MANMRVSAALLPRLYWILALAVPPYSSWLGSTSPTGRFVAPARGTKLPLASRVPKLTFAVRMSPWVPSSLHPMMVALRLSVAVLVDELVVQNTVAPVYTYWFVPTG